MYMKLIVVDTDCGFVCRKANGIAVHGTPTALKMQIYTKSLKLATLWRKCLNSSRLVVWQVVENNVRCLGGSNYRELTMNYS